MTAPVDVLAVMARQHHVRERAARACLYSGNTINWGEPRDANKRVRCPGCGRYFKPVPIFGNYNRQAYPKHQAPAVVKLTGSSDEDAAFAIDIAGRAFIRHGDFYARRWARNGRICTRDLTVADERAEIDSIISAHCTRFSALARCGGAK